MSGTTPVAGLPFMTTRGTSIEHDALEEHVSLLTLLDCTDGTSQQELVTSFYNQFKDTKKANFIFFDTCKAHDTRWIETLSQGAWVVPCADSLRQCVPVLNSWPAGKPYALVDRKGVIRNYYDAGNTDEKRIMLEHMALLIPREHSEKVELKRGQEK